MAAADPVLPASWEKRADKLEQLMRVHARKRRAHTEIYAKAYLAADGALGVREQVAKFAAAEAQLAYDDARAELEAYRLLLASVMDAPPCDES